MENHQFSWVNQRTQWPFSLATLNYQRVAGSRAMSKIPLMMGEFARGSWFVGIMTQGMEYLLTNQYT